MATDMIHLYYAATPNGLKIRLFLEETDMPCVVHPIDLAKGEQFDPGFLAISPNNKIPAIVDDAPAAGAERFALFESGAILLYLAEKTGRLLSADPRRRMETLQWLFWQVGGLGPMAGQAGHFGIYAPEPVPYAIERYRNETRRLYGVLDRHLADREFIAGDYSIADIASYPWIVPHAAHGQDLNDFPDLHRWFDTIAARPATIRAYAGVANVYDKSAAGMTDEQRRILFGPGGTASGPDEGTPG